MCYLDSDTSLRIFRDNENILHNSSRPLIENLNDFPFPVSKYVENFVQKYQFTAMAGKKTRYALIEGSRGCSNQSTFCSQWKQWGSKWRIKSSKRIADEFEFCFHNYGSRFLWLTDDNYGLDKRAGDLTDELLKRGFTDDIIWFMQIRCKDVVKHSNVLPKHKKAGLRWVLLGVESDNSSTLDSFKKEITLPIYGFARNCKSS
jgi:anaerobic magnesium-protoporphyrin IX monomethyl ester cyclase